MSNISNNKRIARNTIFLYLRMAVVMIVNLYTTRIVFRNLGVNDYGIYNVVYGFVTLFSVLNVTLTVGLNRYYNYALGTSGLVGVRKIFNVAIRIQALFAILLWLLVESFGLWYVNTTMVMPIDRVFATNWLLQFSILSMIFMIIANPFSSLVMAYEKMDYFAIISILDVFFKLVVAIGLSFAPCDKLIYYGAAMSIISAADFLAYYIYTKIQFANSIKIEKYYDRSVFKNMLKFSGWMSLDPIAYSINGQGVNMLLNLFFGTVINTAFGIANQVGQAIDSFCMNLTTAFRPQMVQSYSSGDKSRSLKLFSSMTKISFFLFVLLCIPIALNMEYIYDLWLGNTYPTIALQISMIFIFVKMIGCLNHPISYLIMAKGNVKIYMITTSLITSSILLVAYILLKLGLSVPFVFIAMLIISVINQIASVRILSIEIPEITQEKYYKSIMIPCVILLIIVLIVVIIPHSFINPGLFRFVIDMAFSAIATIIAAYYVCMDSNEKSIFFSIINNVFHRK